MAINILRAKVRREGPTPTTIGEADANVFSCPACARPLVVGARRCPGCGIRLVMGIQLGRVGLFLTLGVALGSLLGGGAVALIVQGGLASTRIASGAGVESVPIVEPIATGAAVAAPVGNPEEPTSREPGGLPGVAVPPIAIWSLTQSAMIDARIAAVLPVLVANAATDHVDTAAVASALRSITGDAASGADLANRLAAWPAASGLAADLGQFYGDARNVARDGLAASMSNTAAYRRAAQEMLGVLGSMGTLDARSRLLAETAGVTLVPVTLPYATDAAGPTGPGAEPLP